jgi:YbgC/YbaW family acyl-CoA thioester hydrolase
VFAIDRRVSPEEVDVFRVVHFSNYLKWCSSAMTEMFHKLGVGIGTFEGGAVEIRVGRLQMVYMRSVRLNDLAHIRIADVEIKDKRMVLLLSINVEGRVCARGRLTVAFVKAETGELTSFPTDLAGKLVEWRQWQEAELSV